MLFYFGMSESKTQVLKLEVDNYYGWSYHMELRLRKSGVWSIVNGKESRPPGSNNHKMVKGWVTRSELALNEIVSAVGDSQLVLVMCRLRLGLKALALAWLLEAARAWRNHRPGQKPKVGPGLAWLWLEPRLLGDDYLYRGL